MQVFEFHFNPPFRRSVAKTMKYRRQGFGEQTKPFPDLIFDSFCYEPENIYEKRMGSFYMAGLLKNVLPQNTRFIEKLVKVIKDKYYRSTIFTPEKSLKESLKVANEFLEKITKRGDVSWLGNLSFTVISLANFKMNFTKVGHIKVLLIRTGKIIDIDEKVRLQDIEPYPLKIFSNIVSGKLSEGDMILVLTEDIFNFFQNQNLLEEIAKLDPFSEKGLKEILNGKEELLADISGLLLTIVLTKETWVGKKKIISPKVLKEFSIKEVFSPISGFFKKAKTTRYFSPQDLISALRSKVKKPSISLSSVKVKLKLPEIKLPRAIDNFFNTKIRPLFLNKKIALILALSIILIFGFIFSKLEQEKNIKIYGKDLQDIQEKLNLVDSLLILKETSPEANQRANLLLKESWEEISSLSIKVIGLPKDFANQVFSLKNEISEKLSDLNRLERIEEPQLIFEFERKTFIPHKVLVLNNNLYFFSPYIENIFRLTEKGQSSIIETGQKITLATGLDDFLCFFSKPDQLIILKNNELTPFSLQRPYADFNFDDLASFKNNLYFLDKKAGQIIKYPYSGNLNWGSPQLWLNPKTPKVIGANSFTIDGSAWVLNQNLIYKYYGGELQKEINLEIFPISEDFSKIFTSPTLSYLYILEPVQKRVIVIDKSAKIIKQFQSEKFDNLLDFGVSENGKTIYLLNGLKVFKIEF